MTRTGMLRKRKCQRRFQNDPSPSIDGPESKYAKLDELLKSIEDIPVVLAVPSDRLIVDGEDKNEVYCNRCRNSSCNPLIITPNVVRALYAPG